MLERRTALSSTAQPYTFSGFAGARMFNSSTMMKMVDEVIRDHDLPYQVKRIFEPPDQSWTWCAEFVDPNAADAHHAFEICVRWPYGSNYESVKADLARQLLAHLKR
jgi:hypothetical protein